MNLINSLLDKLDNRDIKKITTVVLHHTVLSPTLDITDVAAFEMNKFGFLTVGYNCYIKKIDDYYWEAQQGRPINKLPAAQYGFNAEGYAIAVGGNYEPGATTFDTTISPGMISAVVGQIHALREHYPWIKYLIGHRDIADMKKKLGKNPSDYATLCPGQTLYDQLGNIRKMTGLLEMPS